MAIITFISDFGTKDHYVAAVKARIYRTNPGLQIIDITHNIPKLDIGTGAFVLRSVFHDFPMGTVHLCAVDCGAKTDQGFVAVKMREHLFVGPNNGMISLLSEEKPSAIADIALNKGGAVFPARDILAEVAAKLASGTTVHDMGKPTELERKIDRKARATKKQIAGHIIYIDDFGNLITNIEKTDFDILSKDRSFEVTFARESFRQIHRTMDQVENGDCFLLFNSLDLLEIGINKGDASQLLGMRLDSPVIINFDE